MHKIFKHRKLPCIHAWGKRILSCGDTTFFLCFFPFIPFETQLFSTPVTSSNLRNQAPLFTRGGRCQTKFLTCEISDFISCMHAQTNILYTKFSDKTDY